MAVGLLVGGVPPLNILLYSAQIGRGYLQDLLTSPTLNTAIKALNLLTYLLTFIKNGPQSKL